MESLELTLRPDWYLPAPTAVPPAALEIFEKYTDLPAADVLPHLIAIVSHPHTPPYRLKLTTDTARPRLESLPLPLHWLFPLS